MRMRPQLPHLFISVLTPPLPSPIPHFQWHSEVIGIGWAPAVRFAYNTSVCVHMSRTNFGRAHAWPGPAFAMPLCTFYWCTAMRSILWTWQNTSSLLTPHPLTTFRWSSGIRSILWMRQNTLASGEFCRMASKHD